MLRFQKNPPAGSFFAAAAASVALLMLVFAIPVAHATQEKPAPKSDDATTAPKSAVVQPESAPSDAGGLTRLQRSIDDGTRQLEDLRTRIEAPNSEFSQSQAAFTELERQLTEKKKELEAADRKTDPAQVTALSQAVEELTATHKLAKERFDLAIRERKMLQSQLAAQQQKLAQDTEALRKAKGELPAPASQPVVETKSVAPAAGAPVPTAPPSEGDRAPAVATPVIVVPPKGSDIPVTLVPEVLKARADATRKQSEAQSAHEDAKSLLDRISGLQDTIQLEQRLFGTSRLKVENAQATERTLYEALQRKWNEGAPQSEIAELRTQITEARVRLREAQEEMHERTDRRGSFQAELSALQAEHIAAMEEAAHAQGEADKAVKLVESLESPLSPRNLWRWLLERGPRVAGIVVAMFVLLWSARLAEGRIAALLSRGRNATAADRENRAKTLVGVFHGAVTIAVYAGGGLMILTEVGVNIVPLMGGAAVLGLAAAFGAQNLIRDYFYGFMILLENQYTVNDVVKLGDLAGQVERITLRVTVLRDLDGTVHFVPNGQISSVSNLTHEWSRALFDIPIAYREDVDRVMTELVELAKELRRDPEFRGLILEMPEMLGVDEFADSAVIIKFFIKTRPLKQWTVKRELLRRIKNRFDELGIEIPFPQRTIHHRTADGPLHREDLVALLDRGNPQ